MWRGYHYFRDISSQKNFIMPVPFTLEAWKQKLRFFPSLRAILFFNVVSGTLASAYVTYAMLYKLDVRLFKNSVPRFEAIDPSKPQKLMTVNQKWEPIPELEQLKREIGCSPN